MTESAPRWRQRYRRYRRIAVILSRHGLGAVATGLGMGFLVPFHRGILGHRSQLSPYTRAQHVRLALEELGTAAIKLGQILSTRPDLLPPELMLELEKLRNNVPPAPTASIAATLAAEWGRNHDQVLSWLDPVPLASASIGQVHAARLHDGTEVVVKVRKPGVREEVETDLDILSRIAARIALVDHAEHGYDVEELAADFAWTLRSELDYTLEARNADQLRQILANEPRSVVPRVYSELSTPAVLVMERLNGLAIDDVPALIESGFEPAEVARVHAEILLHQVFGAGVFHADPHPGNFLLLADGRIALLDFGMVGRLEEETKRGFVRLLLAAARQDPAMMTHSLQTLGVAVTTDTSALRRDLHRMLDRYYGLAVDEFSLRSYLGDLLEVVRRRRLQLPSDLALLLKAVAMSDGLWRTLDPSFNAYPIGEAYARRLALAEYDPRSLARRGLERFSQLIESGPDAILGGPARSTPHPLAADQRLRRQIREAANQVSRALIATGLLVALAILTSSYRPPLWGLLAPLLFFSGAGALVGVLIRMLIAGRARKRI
jgi:ubiquinone biosynthesis protein